uniref:ANIS5_cation-bd domain-containing protein n=1 Tax=Ascaris lumbricoides TaxID=6252 RepID=A0A0M3HTZ2_ASCLU
MAVAWMLFAVLFYTTFLSDHVLGSCHWGGWGTCYPPFFLWTVSPRAALEYSAIMTDVSKTNSEKQAALEAWASNQSPAVLNALNAYREQRIANMVVAKERRAELAAYLSPEAQTLNAQLIAIAEDEGLTEASRSAQISELMNAASIRGRTEILLLERQLALSSALGNRKPAQQSSADETAAIVAEESPSDSMLVGAEEVPNETSSPMVRQVSSQGNDIWNAVADIAASKEATVETLTGNIAATANTTEETASTVSSEAPPSEKVDALVISAFVDDSDEKTIMKRAANLLSGESTVEESKVTTAAEATADASATNKELGDSGAAVTNSVEVGVPEELVNDTAAAKAVASPAVVDAADVGHSSEHVIIINVTVENGSDEVESSSKPRAADSAALMMQELAIRATSNGSRTENKAVIEEALDDATEVADVVVKELTGRNGDVGNSRRSLFSKKTHISPIVSTLTMFTPINTLSSNRVHALASAN